MELVETLLSTLSETAGREPGRADVAKQEQSRTVKVGGCTRPGAEAACLSQIPARRGCRHRRYRGLAGALAGAVRRTRRRWLRRAGHRGLAPAADGRRGWRQSGSGRLSRAVGEELFRLVHQRLHRLRQGARGKTTASSRSHGFRWSLMKELAAGCPKPDGPEHPLLAGGGPRPRSTVRPVSLQS